jgi:hypothetical protein
MNMMQRGVAWLNAQRNEHAAQDVLYKRGDVILEIPATKGRSVFEGADDYGAQVSAQAWDFLILDVDLNLKPVAGDVIVYAGRRYEVMAFGEEGCWRWSDSERTTLRIHTKDTGAES